jgi:hypothetical protein
MGTINISNNAGRDATVVTQSVRSSMKIRWVDEQGRQANSVRVVKSTLASDIGALTRQTGNISKVAEALIASDPEVDVENVGRFLKETSRIYVDPNGQLVHKVQFWEIIRNPDGTERERRPRKVLETNMTGEVPFKWTGKFIKKDEACRKFVFSGKVQLHHINGLTYDFLFEMAKTLEEKNSLMLLGAGPKSNQPLILKRGGSPYRGFLEGRTQGDKYCLMLHFSNLELKAPEEEGTKEEG